MLLSASYLLCCTQRKKTRWQWIGYFPAIRFANIHKICVRNSYKSLTAGFNILSKQLPFLEYWTCFFCSHFFLLLIQLCVLFFINTAFVILHCLLFAIFLLIPYSFSFFFYWRECALSQYSKPGKKTSEWFKWELNCTSHVSEQISHTINRIKSILRFYQCIH